MGFSLNQIEMRRHAENGVFFDVRHPKTGEPIVDADGNKVQIKVGGIDAVRIKNALEERENQRRNAAGTDDHKSEPASVQGWKEKEDYLIEDIVLLTEGWTDNLELDGKPLPFSKENAAILYRRFPEILFQMRDNAANRLNFIPASASA